MSEFSETPEQYEDPAPPHEVVPTEAPPAPPSVPTEVAPPPPPPTSDVAAAPPPPPPQTELPPADPYATEVVPTDAPPAPPLPPTDSIETQGHSDDAAAVMPAGQPGGYDSAPADSMIPPGQPGGSDYAPVVDQEADEVMDVIDELPEAPPIEDQQPWLDMGSDAEPIEEEYGDIGGYDQQPWPDMGSDAGYVSLDPVELSGCCAMVQQVSGGYEDVAAQLTVTPELESFAPTLTDTLESLRQALQTLATELSGEAGNLQQVSDVVIDDGAALPLSSYAAPAFGSDAGVGAAWSDASAVIGAGQPGGPAAYSYDPNVAVVGGNPFPEITVVEGQNSYAGLLEAINPGGAATVGGTWSSSPTDSFNFVLHDNYDYAAGAAWAEASVASSGYMNDVVGWLNTPQPAPTVDSIILNNIALQGIRQQNQTLFGTYSLFPPTISPIF